MKIVQLFILVALIACVSLSQRVPDLPDEYVAKVTATLYPIGDVQGLLYFDYVNQMERFDFSIWGQKGIEIKKYKTQKVYQIDLASGQCKVDALKFVMYPTQIPPMAEYRGMKNIRGKNCQYWFFNFMSLVDLHYYVANETRDGKEVWFPVQFEAQMMGVPPFKISYDEVVPGQIPSSTFDTDKFNCPPPPVTPPGNNTIEGYIKNAINNQLIKNPVKVVATIGQWTRELTTSTGEYKFTQAPNGIMNIKTSANEFIPSTRDVNVTQDIPKGTTADILMSPVLPDGVYRAVLSWDRWPRDLDLHAMAPGNQCHVYFSNRRCSTANGDGVLDVDVTKGYGPETITLTTKPGASGEWLFYVYQYSTDGGSLTSSNAVLKFYGENGLLQQWNIPTTGSGRSWRVFTFNVQTKQIKTINEIVN
jgi:hypothetical protein